MTIKSFVKKNPKKEKARKIAIIPARGGSKRIPRKNIKSFRGRPMLEWSIKAALESAVFDVVMVSTDDPEICEIARSCGAQTPFMRSEKASDDYATTSDVLMEVLAKYGARGDKFDLACCLYPTAPFVQAQDLTNGLSVIEEGDYDVVMPIVKFDYPIWRSLQRDETGKIALNFPENLNRRSQDLPAAYHDAGQWYWFWVKSFQRNGALIGPRTGSVVLPQSRVQDIDTDDDWLMAELKHEKALG